MENRVRGEPRLARWALRRLLPATHREAVVAELRAAFDTDRARLGELRARRRYWAEVLSTGPLQLRRAARLPSLSRRGDRPTGVDMLERLVQDTRFALRALRRRPGYGVTAAVILAAGIGSATAIFSVVDHVVLRALPYPSAHELVHFDHPRHPVPVYVAWKDRTRSYASMGAAWTARANLTGDGAPSELYIARISADFLVTLGVAPRLGRAFLVDDLNADADAVILGHAAWQRRWGGDPGVVGATLTLDGEVRRVVGVFGPEFEAPEALVGSEVDLWVPLDVRDPDLYNHGRYALSVVGRLAPGISLEAARDELSALAATLAEEDPEHYRGRDDTPQLMEITPLHERTTAEVGPALYTLLGAVGLMLLIACANVANLALARGAERGRELAIRTAIGAGKMRLALQVLTESAVLAALACLLGLVIAQAGVAAFARIDPGGIPRSGTIDVDGRVLLFSMAIAAATGLLFGLVPALQAVRADVSSAMKDGAGGATARRSQRTRAALVVAEVALALVLLVGAGLLFHSFVRLTSVDLGFEAEGIVTFRLPVDRYTGEERPATVRRVVENLRAVPGVRSVGVGTTVPLSVTGVSRCCWFDLILRQPDDPEPLGTMVNAVDEGYFETFDIALSHGRALRPEDAFVRPMPIVVTAHTAQELLERVDVVGERVLLDPDIEMEIVGVMEEVRHWGQAEEPGAQIYVPFDEWSGFFGRFYVGARVAPGMQVAADIRNAVWAVDPTIPVDRITTMQQMVDDSVAGPRFYSILLVIFSSVAVLLAAGGVYGSMLYAVGQRRRELGVRVAVGARSGDIVGMVLRQGLAQALLGIGIGLLVALASARVLHSMVFEITTTDPVTYAAVAVLLALVAVAACAAPARRAARQDPVRSLRGG